jgi:hypothetical protein
MISDWIVEDVMHELSGLTLLVRALKRSNGMLLLRNGLVGIFSFDERRLHLLHPITVDTRGGNRRRIGRGGSGIF